MTSYDRDANTITQLSHAQRDVAYGSKRGSIVTQSVVDAVAPPKSINRNPRWAGESAGNAAPRPVFWRWKDFNRKESKSMSRRSLFVCFCERRE